MASHDRHKSAEKWDVWSLSPNLREVEYFASVDIANRNADALLGCKLRGRNVQLSLLDKKIKVRWCLNFPMWQHNKQDIWWSQPSVLSPSRHNQTSHPHVLLSRAAGLPVPRPPPPPHRCECAEGSRTAGAQPACSLQVGPRERSYLTLLLAHSDLQLFPLPSPSPLPSLLQPHAAAHATLITPIKLWFTVFTPSSCPHCGKRESEECPSPPCPQCSQHAAKCEPISGGGWSAKPQSTSTRWQPSLWWLWSRRSVNNTWPGPAAHSNWGYIPGNTLMNN